MPEQFDKWKTKKEGDGGEQHQMEDRIISLCLNSLIKISEGQNDLKFYSPGSGGGTILRGSGKEASGFTYKCKTNKQYINGKICTNRKTLTTVIANVPWRRVSYVVCTMPHIPRKHSLFIRLRQLRGYAYMPANAPFVTYDARKRSWNF